MITTHSISLSGFNEGNVDYVARAFTDILSRDPLPQSAAPAKAAGNGVLIQPQQPQQVLP